MHTNVWRLACSPSVSRNGLRARAGVCTGGSGPYFVVDEFVLGNTTEKAATFIMRASFNNTSQFFSVVPLPVYYANLEVRYLSSYLGQMLIRTLSLGMEVALNAELARASVSSATRGLLWLARAGPGATVHSQGRVVQRRRIARGAQRRQRCDGFEILQRLLDAARRRDGRERHRQGRTTAAAFFC